MSQSIEQIIQHSLYCRYTMTLIESVLALDDVGVREYLSEHPQAFLHDEAPKDVLHTLLMRKDVLNFTQSPGIRSIVYLLRNHGLDVNSQNQEGDTPLHLVLRRVGDTEICEALLQCGADMHLKNKQGVSALDMVEKQSDIPDRTRELVLKYKPGLWRAVQDDDLMSVRKLINLWSRVDIQKNGRSLKELALSKGTEHIIRLIIDINPSMRLAHSAMAGDLLTATAVCKEHAQININFKNLGDMGATPMFYAIMNNNVGLVELLRRHGAKIDATITFEDNDIPLYFTALNRDIDPEIIKCLNPPRSEMGYFWSLHYKGRTVLQYCIENDISPGVVRHILRLGYPELVAVRQTNSLCAREMAQHLGKPEYVQVIDEVVHDWYLDNSSDHRRYLAVCGYPYLKHAQKDGVQAHEVILSMETSSDQANFDSDLDNYQDHISRLHEAVEQRDLSAVDNLLFYSGPHHEHFQCCLADSKAKNDGQPLIHKAVLRQQTAIVQLLASSMVNSLGIKVDSVVDAWYRTPLHYAYGIPSAKEVVYTLLDHGCSDFTLDKDMRSPLVFRDHRQCLEMHQLIQYHIKKAYVSEEPRPWKPLKIALVGPGLGHRHRSMQRFCQQEANTVSVRSKPQAICQSSARTQPSPLVLRSRGNDTDEEVKEEEEEELTDEVDDEEEDEDLEEDDTDDLIENSENGRMCTVL